MRVAICRLFNNGNHTKRPVVVLKNATNLDTAEEWFNKNERWRYPEYYNWCYINLDHQSNRSLARKGK